MCIYSPKVSRVSILFSYITIQRQRISWKYHEKNILTGEMVIEKEFDFVGWFNQDSGSCLESYRRKKYMG